MTASQAQAQQALQKLREFIGANQMYCVADACQGEERQWFFDKAAELVKRIEALPKLGSQDGTDDPVVHLHYFNAGSDWWITEYTPGDDAFGYACVNGRVDLSELGYISIEELVKVNAELDFHFPLTALSKVKEKLFARYGAH